MPKSNKLRVDMSYQAKEEDEDIPITYCNIDLIHSGDKSAFTSVKQRNESDVILEDIYKQQLESQFVNEKRSLWKNAYRAIKDLFKARAKQVCPCIKDKKQYVTT